MHLYIHVLLLYNILLLVAPLHSAADCRLAIAQGRAVACIAGTGLCRASPFQSVLRWEATSMPGCDLVKELIWGMLTKAQAGSS